MGGVLALDFGGTKLAAGIVDLDRSALVASDRISTPPGGAPASLDAMLGMARELLRGAERRGIRGVGVSFGGPVDAERNVVLRSLHVQGWEAFPIGAALASALHLDVALDNDANAAALGEWRFGAGRGASHMLYYTVSTGVGGGIISGGRLLRGARGVAGELGHVVVDRDGPRCPCGNRGCVEALCAGPAIARRALAALEGRMEGRSLLAPGGVPIDPMTAEIVADAARRGDDLALRVMGEVARDLATGIGAAVSALNPEVVVVGGGVSRAGPVLFDPLLRALPPFVFPASREGLDVRPAALGEHTGLFGAAALFAAREG